MLDELRKEGIDSEPISVDKIEVGESPAPYDHDLLVTLIHRKTGKHFAYDLQNY